MGMVIKVVNHLPQRKIYNIKLRSDAFFLLSGILTFIL